MEPIIKAKDLKVVYNPGKSNEYLALKIDHIEIYPEEYIILFGPSGCGKSTLLYTLFGILPATGELSVKGINPYAVPIEEVVRFQQYTIGIIYQSFNLIPSLTVLDNVCLPQIFADIPKPERHRRGMDLLARFGVEKQAHKLPTNLSGGQMQRIAVARSLVGDPEILLADEPVGNLDSISTMQVMNTLDEINSRDKKTIILVTHDAKHLPYAHRVYYIRDGRVEREVINPEKKQIKKIEPGKTILTQVERLARAYPYSSQTELRVKSIVNYLTQDLTFEQLAVIEKLILATIDGKIQKGELQESLNRPLALGGAELSAHRARDFMDRIEHILDESSQVRRFRRRWEEKIFTPKQDDRVSKLREALLAEAKLKLTSAELEEFDEKVLERAAGLIQMEDFETYLTTPKDEKGVGLSRKDALLLSRFFETIIAQGTH